MDCDGSRNVIVFLDETFLYEKEVQCTLNICSKMIKIKYRGAAHRNIKCVGALHLTEWYKIYSLQIFCSSAAFY
jgi:hypothetical protein